ncbi:acyltransferase domain-containing protein [Microlunatus sp. GCM10028923]|uniref:acyltransferase domain-containing protein n=1 Tax=Microlunatus sp. GCM10028923 TaxID=3273400 RepID=UPI00360FFA0C
MNHHASTPAWQRLSLSEVARTLALEPDVVERLTPVAGPDGPRLSVPDHETADRLLARLNTEPEDRATTLAARPDPDDDPELCWLLDRSARLLISRLGRRPPGNPAWAALPGGPVARHLYVWVFLTVLPYVRDHHADLGLNDDESWASLGALGSALASDRRVNGRPGLDATWGLPMTFSGTGFRLGRLAYERQPRHTETGHPVLRPGESALNTHIPGNSGPLTPAACDASFDRALELARGFPEQVAGFGCHSWLMDDQLAGYLPAGSNIIRFQRRFTAVNDRMRADWAPILHVFGRRFDGPVVPPALLDELPQRTSLERAVVGHLRDGGHWYNQTGWFRRLP